MATKNLGIIVTFIFASTISGCQDAFETAEFPAGIDSGNQDALGAGDAADGAPQDASHDSVSEGRPPLDGAAGTGGSTTDAGPDVPPDGNAGGGAGGVGPEAGQDGEAGAAGSGGNSVCGNQVKEWDEICDGTDLSGSSCSDYPDFNTGTLLCSPDCAAMVTSSCQLLCAPGTYNAPSSVTASGNGSFFSGYARFIDGAEFYTESYMEDKTFPGMNFPGEMVFAGAPYLHVTLVFAAASDGVPFYEVDITNVPACSTINYYSQPCSAKVAKDFRCQYFPSSETDCDIQAAFTPLGKQSVIATTGATKRMVLAAVRCKP